MPRQAGANERQSNLFGWPAASAAASRSRPRKRASEPAVAEPESATAFAERAAQADLDEFVDALSDEALTHLALTSARQLKRRIARAGSSRTGKAKKRLSPLERVGQGLAREWASRIGSDETW